MSGTPTLDPAHVAGLALDALHDLGWRHVPRPQPITTGRSGTPPPDEWRRAREQLAHRPTEGDTDA